MKLLDFHAETFASLYNNLKADKLNKNAKIKYSENISKGQSIIC